MRCQACLHWWIGTLANLEEHGYVEIIDGTITQCGLCIHHKRAEFWREWLESIPEG